MPVLPEKSNRARSAVHAQFWDQTDHSPRSIDGVAWKLPCEPTSMPLLAPSGVSRSQQLIAAQTLGVPALPSYDEHSGGLVLDRNVLKFGGDSWWSAVSCRVKTQKMYSDSAAKKAFQSSEISDWLKPLTVSSNYGLMSRTHAKAGPVIFDSTIEALDAGALSMAFSNSGPDGQPQIVPNVSMLGEALATHSSVRMDVHGHSIGASLATNLDVGGLWRGVRSSAEGGVSRYIDDDQSGRTAISSWRAPGHRTLVGWELRGLQEREADIASCPRRRCRRGRGVCVEAKTQGERK